ncbi:hypothetical protein GXW82_35825 [Streptacidiphilus sp. 4-A2]|nr:hypothetical protein [Streptacidiphilus sp. 4-A2]
MDDHLHAAAQHDQQIVGILVLRKELPVAAQRPGAADGPDGGPVGVVEQRPERDGRGGVFGHGCGPQGRHVGLRAAPHTAVKGQLRS